MPELEKYNNAMQYLSVNQESNQMPLHSWDFFSDYYETLKEALEDVNHIQEIAQENRWNGNWNFLNALQEQKTVVVTDANLKIVFASQNITQMTGFETQEIIGNTTKMFQGKKTSKKDLKEIREFIDSQKAFEKTILNYKKNGEEYNCVIQAFPIFNSKKQLVNFVAFEKAA